VVPLVVGAAVADPLTALGVVCVVVVAVVPVVEVAGAVVAVGELAGDGAYETPLAG
jgi:hypothetical protein